MSELSSTENTSPRKRGRPKGSKNKPKQPSAPVSEAIPTPIPPVLTPEGLPNLPFWKIVGRPIGKSRSLNSKKSEVIIEEDDVRILPVDSPSLLSE